MFRASEYETKSLWFIWIQYLLHVETLFHIHSLQEPMLVLQHQPWYPGITVIEVDNNCVTSAASFFFQPEVIHKCLSALR